MLLSKLKVIRSHGRQYIPALGAVTLAAPFRGRPVISGRLAGNPLAGLIEGVCPSAAFRADPLSIDLGRCVFCGECARMAPNDIVFTPDYRMATNVRENLVIRAGEDKPVEFDPEKVRDEICSRYRRSLRLREISAGGDNSDEMELNASMNVNFDFGRYGVEFTASPRHADGIVITGPITENMARALDICYCSVADPKVVVLAGSAACSGGIFADSPALDRSFLDNVVPDLYLPGNPLHPMTFIDGVLTLLRHGKR